MSTLINHRIVLASRPVGEAELTNFRLEATEVPALQDGEVLVRHHYLSLDPYMRMRMNDVKSYAAPQALGQTMIGGTVGEVLQSRHEAYAPGEHVVGMGGWQELAVVDARTPGLLRKVDTTRIPLSAYLGAVGMPGVTAWVGLNHIIEPQAGQTIVVDAASGAVGSAVGQLAKARGCRVVVRDDREFVKVPGSTRHRAATGFPYWWNSTACPGMGGVRRARTRRDTVRYAGTTCAPCQCSPDASLVRIVDRPAGGGLGVRLPRV
jgi:hypothetical protein